MSLLNSARQATAVVGCAPSLLYDILTYYDNYFEWLPLVAQSKLLAREGDLAIAEFELAFPQKDRLNIECIHTRNKMVLWRTIGGKIPISQVQWDIESGQGGQCQVSLTLEQKATWRR